MVVDKPSGWTSHDVVNKIRRFADTRKVGHLGTLDPMATGVLPLLIGRATRLAQFFGKADKVYEGSICFGHSTDSYDAEGKPTSPDVAVDLDRSVIEELLAIVPRSHSADSAACIGKEGSGHARLQTSPTER